MNVLPDFGYITNLSLEREWTYCSILVHFHDFENREE